ncbi:MAG: DUF2334 domain-containing protein [Nanoarchaeota archaeon]
MKLKKLKSYFIGGIIGILIVFLVLIAVRTILPRQIDDVSPVIPCSQGILDRGSSLMVIPLFENKSIAENKSWCEYILSLNKTLGMHGVTHRYGEFREVRDLEYLQVGIREFEKCFGKSPYIFEAPHLVLNSGNYPILKEANFSQIRGWFYTITHKVYHCQDTGEFAIKFEGFRITNKLISRI